MREDAPAVRKPGSLSELVLSEVFLFLEELCVIIYCPIPDCLSVVRHHNDKPLDAMKHRRSTRVTINV